MKPSIRVARFSFFLASLLFSLSGSRGFDDFDSTPESSLPDVRPPSPCSLLSLPRFLRPKMGWQRRSFKGFTTAHLDTTPLSDDDGSNSDTMSTSMPTLGALHRDGTLDWPSPFTDSVAFRLLFCTGTGIVTCPTDLHSYVLIIVTWKGSFQR